MRSLVINVGDHVGSIRHIVGQKLLDSNVDDLLPSIEMHSVSELSLRIKRQSYSAAQVALLGEVNQLLSQ